MEAVDLVTKIPGYRVTEQLYTGSRTLVYRSIRKLDGQPVVIKLLRHEYPTFSELLQFRNQYTIAKNIDLPGVVRPYSLENYRNSYALVMEDFGGISLRKYTSGHPLCLREFFEIALQIVATLEGLYRYHVIHKDLKPANILINPTSKQVKLIDFSIASLLPRETQEIKSPNVLEGTLAYLSPEQTGRMNRGIDYRTDFYSLGITFYELLTGQLPFETNDPMELIHCHLTRQPSAAHSLNPTIPAILSEIISKLMVKNAEDRYQSALGLKHDLEVCFNQWKETGTIVHFELAKRDICDRFVISEKLYGRQAEVETLLAAFDRVSQGSSELMLVAGFSGIGKTAVVNEVHKPIVRQRGYFIKGKFDQFQRHIPFWALVQAFRDLMGQLLSESDDQLKQWKDKVLAALGENGQVIVDVIPELELIIGSQPVVPELSGEAAQNRFNLLFKKFIRVFTTEDHPLAVFIDDLQWADSASLKLMQLLMSETDTHYLLFIGAYRDNEVSPTHPLVLTLEKLEQVGATINTITLAPLALLDLNHLIADTLTCPQEMALPFTELVYRKTGGNPFFSNQFLRAMHQGGLINFNFESGYWQCDIAQIKALAITNDVVEFMAGQLQKLPKATQEVLKLAACIGNEFDLDTLAIVYQKSIEETATDLWKALQEGLIIPKNEVYKFFQGYINEASVIERGQESIQLPITHYRSPNYKFLHDRVQQAAYFLIPEAQKKATHLQIGQLLLCSTPVEKQEEKIFEIVNQLNVGVDLIDTRSEKDELIRLNLIASRKAKSATAYEPALRYLNIALDLLAGDSWQSQYELTMNVYLEAIEAEYLNTNFERAEQLVKIALTQGKELLDTVKVYEKQLLLFIAQNKISEVLPTAKTALAMLGVDLPEEPGEPSALVAMLQEEMSSRGIHQIEELSDLNLMTDPYKLEALRILMILFAPFLISHPHLRPLLGFKMVDLCIKYGNSPLATFAYVFYGWLLCGVLGDIESGYQFGQLGVNLLSKFEVSEINCKTEEMFYGFVKHWKDHLNTTLNPLLETFQSGIDVGDLEYASYSAIIYSYNILFTGKPLDFVTQEQEKYINVMRRNKQEFLVRQAGIFRQLGLQLIETNESKYQLIGESFDEAVLLPVLLETNTIFSIFSAYFCKAILCYLLKDYHQALENARLADKYVVAVGGLDLFAEHHFYYSLALLAACSGLAQSDRAAYLEKVEANQQKMKVWADHAPMNYQHKYDLVEAEKLRICQQIWQAAELYDRAIQAAKQQEYLQEEALANELAAEFYLAQGRDKLAEAYLVDAYYGYARWGAKVKADDLKERYPQLFAPMLQREKLYFNSNESISASEGASPLSDRSIAAAISSSSSSTSEALDLATVMKASQTLSSEIHLDKLLSTLMQVMMENAGAEKCVLMLAKGDDWTIEAMTGGTGTANQFSRLHSLPVEESFQIPLSIINYVKRTFEILVIRDATAQTTWAADPYILQQQPKSLFCSPILHQGKLVGILYLENNQCTGAFTSDRVAILNLLCSQAAISLENARLYQQSQDYAQKLEEFLRHLQQMQIQLVQSEKMSALGNLVAGVAHEINNPVGFIGGNLQPAQDYVQDLLKLIDLYQEKFPQPGTEIEDEMEAIDLEYLREDLPKLIASMKEGVERIRDISNSLRIFSRADSDRKVSFNLHEGIDSTILILKHRFKANEFRPAVEVVKEYAILPQVYCFPGQLNQVFMNLLANAIDALEESNQGRSFEEIKASPNRITIQTAMHDEHHVVIRIRDNGVGMSEEVKQRAFDHLFTTKTVGHGTGLGLAIARQIVVEKHRGTLEVSSSLGEGSEFVMILPIKAEVN